MPRRTLLLCLLTCALLASVASSVLGAEGITVDSPAVTEGTGEGTTTVTFTVTNASGGPATVFYEAQEGTATSPEDFAEPTPIPLVFAGDGTQPVTVEVVQDAVDEADEQFTLALSDTPGGEPFTTGTATITDDDAEPTFSAGDDEATEGENLVFTVTKTGATEREATVAYTIVDETTDAGDHGDASGDGTLEFAPGETSMEVTVPATDDSADESDEETLTLDLSNPTPTGATVAENGDGTGTITDNDAEPTFSANDDEASEGGVLTFTVTKTGATERATSVDYAIVDETTDADDHGDASGDGTLEFAPGDTSMEVTVPTTDDGVDEEDPETLTLALSEPTDATIAENGDGTGTITDNDAEPTFSSSDDEATEGEDLVFTVTKTGATEQATTVTYAIVDGTTEAEDRDDPDSDGGTLEFAADETTKQVTVPTKSDMLDEDSETLTLDLSNATNATVAGEGDGTGTITDGAEDLPPTLSVADAPSQDEGNSGSRTVSFTVTLSAASGREVEVTARTDDVSAIAGEDYTAVSPRVTFGPGDMTKTVAVQVSGDTAVEENEDFVVRLVDEVNAVRGDDLARHRISNDDAAPAGQPDPPSVSVSDSGAVEGEPAGFALTLSKEASGPTTVRYTTVDGSATAQADYRTVAGMVTFGARETQKVVPVSTLQDAADEPDENFTLQLNAADGMTIGDGTGAASIADDDAPAAAPPPALVKGKLTAALSPARDRKAPFAYILSGSLTARAGAAREVCGLGGRIVVRVLRRDSRVVTTKRTTLSDRCTYKLKLRFKRRKPLGNGKLRVRTSYEGNAALAPVKAAQRAIRAG